jgi:hypothetical protein
MSLYSRDFSQVAELVQQMIDREFNKKQGTLRDRFAMAALKTLGNRWADDGGCDYRARLAYKEADAMMKAREEKP